MNEDRREDVLRLIVGRDCTYTTISDAIRFAETCPERPAGPYHP